MLSVSKLGSLWQPGKIYSSNRAVTLLSNNYFRYTLLLAVFVVIIISVYKHYYIGILLYGS